MSRRWSLFTVIAISTGSPSCTTERLVAALIENCVPTAPAKAAGRSVSGNGLTSNVCAAPLARNSRDAERPKKSAGPLASATVTCGAGTSILPAVRGATYSVSVSRVNEPFLSTTYGTASCVPCAVSSSTCCLSTTGGALTVTASESSSGIENDGCPAG